MNNVYVITAVHNRKDITRRLIESLKMQAFKRIRLILVDDGSTDGTDVMVKEIFPNSTVLYGNGNLWWGGALHMAYQFLNKKDLADDDDVILYTNDDSRFDSDFIKNGVELLSDYKHTLLTGCGYGIVSGDQIDGAVDFNLKNGAVRILEPGQSGNCASTRALFMTFKTYKHIGGFHPVLLPHYASDYEYTIRGYKKGHPVISSERLKYQFSEDTTGDNSHNNLSLKKMFSKRSKLNPFYKLNFILMIMPIYRLPRYIRYQMKNFKNRG
jgi:GT2 family glycosyltransferase